MRIAMFTNNYLPFVGGSALSVHRFTEKLRARGHAVLVVAPEYDEQPEGERESEVLRVTAVKNFNRTEFSVPLPLNIDLRPRIRAFGPDIIHTHHPFFLGDTALRVAASLDIPIVATHHTEYEHYLHYLPEQVPGMATFVRELAVGHANLCNANIAPSKDIGAKMVAGGVTAPVTVIPTGVDRAYFARGDGQRARADAGIPAGAPVLGHVGRLAPEKNLEFLLDAALRALEAQPEAWLLIVGDGPSLEALRTRARAAPAGDRAVFAGRRTGTDLVDAYHAMDVFVFASYSETQGMVILEAMAAGAPVVALDAPGVRDVVEDGVNGRLLQGEDPEAFAREAVEVLKHTADHEAGVAATADRFSLDATTDQLIDLYTGLLGQGQGAGRSVPGSPWEDVLRRMKVEWDIWSNRVESAVDALGPDSRAKDPDSNLP